MKILIIEDDSSASDYLKDSLDQLGIKEVDVVQTLAEASQILKLKHFHILFLDLSLPGSDVKHSIQFILHHPTHKIIIYSGNEDESVILECVKSGAVHFLSKDYLRIEDLKRALEYAK